MGAENLIVSIVFMSGIRLHSILAIGMGRQGDTVSIFFAGTLDDPVGPKPRFLRGDWLKHKIRTENLSIIGMKPTC